MSLKLLPSLFISFMFITLSVTSSFGDTAFDELYNAGKYKKAIEYANAKIKKATRTLDIWIKLGDAHEKSNSPVDKIKACYFNAQKVNPSEPRVYIGLGNCSKKEKKFEAAIKQYQRSFILKRTAIAAEGIAIVALILKDKDKARDAAESAIGLDKNIYESRLILKDIYRGEKNYKDAAEQLEFIVIKKPKSLKYLSQLAFCYEKTANVEKLAIVDPKIIALSRKNVKSRLRHAEYSVAKNDHNTAYTLFKELAVLTPNDAKIFKNLYEIATKKDSKSDAILYLKNYIALDSSSAVHYKSLGNLLYASKDLDGALAAYRKALKRDSSIKGFYKNYESIVLQKKYKKEAIKVIKGAIVAKEADVKSYVAAANIYRELKQYSNAIKMYKEALKTETKNTDLLTSMGDCQAKSKKITNAIITFEQVLLLKANATIEYKILGDLHLKLKKTAKAIKSYKKYLSLVPTDGKIARQIGLYEYGNKKYKNAISFLEKVKDAKYHTIKYLTALGDSYYKTKNYAKATNVYAKIRAKKAGSVVLKKILKPLGESYEKIGKNKLAAEAYNAYTKISGVKDADASYMKAYLREESDKVTAVKMYEANIKVFTKDPRSFLRLGLIYSEDKTKQIKAASMLNKASLLVTKDPIIWKTLGEIYGKLKNEAKELSSFKKLLTIEPQNVYANRRVGTILLKRKKYSESIINLEMVLTNMPNDVEIIEMLAVGYSKTKRPGKSVGLLTKAKKLKPENVKIRTDLIVACKKAGKKDLIPNEKAELAKLDQKIITKDKKNITSRSRLANYLYIKNEFNKAYTIYKELSLLTPKDKIVFKRIYEIALKNNSKKEAIEYLQKYLKLDRKNSKAHVVLGNLYYEQKNDNSALSSYRSALKSDPSIKGFYKKYAEIVVKKGLNDEAIKVLQACIANKENDKKTFITLGKIFQKKKMYSSAIKMFQKASDADPKNSAVLTSLADCQAKSGNISASILTYEQVVLINPGAKNEYKALGDLQMKQKKVSNAIKTYRKYLEKVPTDNAIAKTVGIHYYKNKKYKDAITYLDMVKDVKLHNALYLLALGKSHYQLKNYGKAANYFAKVSKRKVSLKIRKDILKPLAICYEKTGKKKEAANAYLAYTKLKGVKDGEASYKKAFLREGFDKKTSIIMYNANIKVFKTDHRSFLRLGLIYANSKNTLAKSASMLSAASSLKPKKSDILEKLGSVHGQLKNRNKELSTYKKLLALNPQNIVANRRVGTILMKKKKFTEAIINLEIISTMAPNDVDIMLLLANGYLETKRPVKAIELLAKAKSIKKKDPEIGSLLYKLYKQTGKDKKAEEEIKALIILTKDNKLRTTYAKDLVEQKRFEEANVLVKKINKVDPSSVEGLMLLGKILQFQNKLSEATETYKMISYIKDNYSPAICERGNIYFIQGDVARAKTFYNKAIKSNPKNALAYLGLSKVAKNNKNTANHAKYLKKANALDPDNKEIKAEMKKK